MVGQHIRVLKSGRWIHAVDCGDETVLHLAEESPPPRVRRAYRPDFVAGAEAVEVVTHRERTFPAREIVRRGYSRASDPALAAMFHDSEAFVEWCTTGRLTAARSAPPDAPQIALSVPAAAAPPAAPPPPAPRARPAAPARSAARKAKAKTKARVAAKPAAKTRARAKPAPRKAKPAAKAKARAPKAAAKRPAPARRPATKRTSPARKGRR